MPTEVTLTGNDGDNIITFNDNAAPVYAFGGLGNDVLDAALAGGGWLYGQEGDDVLIASYNATFVGGLGADTLTSLIGQNEFVYNSVDDSTAEQADTINNFDNTDIIDLSAIDADTTAIGNQAFNFIGSESFSNSAGQLRFADSNIYGDVNGDGTTDFEIHLPGTINLDPNAFFFFL